MMKLLPKKEIKKLEHSTTPIENIWNGTLDGKPLGSIKRFLLCNKMIKLCGWYHTHGLTTSTPIKKHWKKMTRLLGHVPSCYPTYEFRNALWGFEWEKEKVLLYYSIRGISIQVPQNFTKEKIRALIDFLIGTLCL